MSLLSITRLLLVFLSGLSLVSGFLPVNLRCLSKSTQDTLQGHRRCVLFSTEDDQEPPESAEETIAAPSAPTPAPVKRLDPLVASLTRNDRTDSGAPTTQVPLLGQVELDQSLFIVLPVIAFAVIGFGMSAYVALNSGDAFVEAAQSVNDALTTPKPLPDPDACRGLCSSQEQDLEGLRVFMDGLRK